MSPYAEHLRKWIAFDGPAFSTILERLNIAFDDGNLTREEYLTLLETPRGLVLVNAPGGAS
jgi:hypothetical protein